MDLLIENAVSIDCETGDEKKISLGITDGKIEKIFMEERPSGQDAQKRVDACGAYLLPGLIDFHTHLFTHGSTFGVNGDLLISGGVTMAVDMGTAGCLGYEAFRSLDVLPRELTIKSFLNLSPLGQPGAGISEPLGKQAIKEAEMEALISKYPEEIRGIKVRFSKGIVDGLGMEPLEKALELGEKWNLPVCVHTTNPPVCPSEIVRRLRPGDIYSHMYQNKGMTILNQDGNVYREFKEAQERGVILEVGNGRMNFDFEIARKAIQDGIYPDIISSDATVNTLYQTPAMKDLPYVMSKFWSMGMPLSQIIRSVTETPAKCLGMENEAGFLKEGRAASLTVLRPYETQVVFQDSAGNTQEGNRVLIPEMTVINGRILYIQGQIQFQ